MGVIRDSPDVFLENIVLFLVGLRGSVDQCALVGAGIPDYLGECSSEN